MGKDRGPWQFRDFNSVCNLSFLDLGRERSNTMMFPAFADPYGFSQQRYFQLNSALMPPSNPTGFTSGQKRFMVFDQSGDQTSLVFSSLGTQFPNTNPTITGLDILGGTETYIPDGNGNEEMHEDTEEIDALLYSDSDNDYEEEEASTGHSPLETPLGNSEVEEEVESSAVLQPPLPPPAKRRVEPELDPSLADTASSTHCGGNDSDDRKKVKRERIQEAVGLLRRIIPGGKSKDAASVLDEAIRYLKSLRLKAKGLGANTVK